MSTFYSSIWCYSIQVFGAISFKSLAKLRLIIWRNFIPLIKVSFRFFFKRWGVNSPYTRKPRKRLNRSGFIIILLLKRNAVSYENGIPYLVVKTTTFACAKATPLSKYCHTEIRLTLRELASSTCFLKTVFLSFLHTRVSCQETCRLKCWSVRFFVSLA